jgi:hypothetical protein
MISGFCYVLKLESQLSEIKTGSQFYIDNLINATKVGSEVILGYWCAMR